MHSNNPFIQGQSNLRFLVKAKTSREYNEYLFNQININDKKTILVLNIFSSLIYFINIIGTFFFLIYKFIASIYSFRWRVGNEEYENFDELFLFFINHFPDRCKAAGIYEKSKYWIVSPAINSHKYKLEGKIIVDYRHYLTKLDSFRIFFSSIIFLVEYIIKVRNICLVHKIWDFYEVSYSLSRIGKKSTFYFSNQSDKFALLFDQLESKEKILYQHGIVANWGRLPYRLNNITEFYSMSNQTWQDAYKNLFSNAPRLVIMQPTIALTTIPKSSLNVLIVAEIDYINIEKVIIEELSKDKSITVYLKKHPALINDTAYKELKEKYGFNYITNKIFPKVDFVISYYSTLAYEYIAYGVPVYMYMSKEEFDKDEMIKQMIGVRQNINRK